MDTTAPNTAPHPVGTTPIPGTSDAFRQLESPVAGQVLGRLEVQAGGRDAGWLPTRRSDGGHPLVAAPGAYPGPAGLDAAIAQAQLYSGIHSTAVAVLQAGDGATLLAPVAAELRDRTLQPTGSLDSYRLLALHDPADGLVALVSGSLLVDLPAR